MSLLSNGFKMSKRAGAVGGADAAFLAAQNADSPVARWLLAESSGTTAADDIGSIDLTHTNSPTLAVADPFGGNRAVYYNGSNQYSFATASAIGASPVSFTLEVFVNAAPVKDKYFFAFGSSTDNDPVVALKAKTFSTPLTGLAAFVRNNAGSHIYEPGIAANVVSFDSTWHLVHLVFDSAATAKIYVDAVEAHRASVGTAGVTLNRTCLGALLRASPALYMACSLAYPTVYTTALTPARIAAHYAATGL